MTATSGSRYAKSFLAVLLVFAIANCIDLLRLVACCDFIYRWGFPFAFFITGGFQGMRQVLWFGAAADLVIFVGLTAILGRAWNRRLAK
jgi:hypothetical protein